MTIDINSLREAGLSGTGISQEQALAIGELPISALPDLWAAAAAVRDKHIGRTIRMCSIVNAKSGTCGENCAFCAQSSHHDTGVETYPLLSADELIESGRKAFQSGACEFSIVTSGTRVSEDDVNTIAQAVATLKKEFPDNSLCASLGLMPAGALERLKQAGLQNFHHNLETSRGHFGNICTTHEFDDAIDTVKEAAGSGLKVCCGGIFGLGEDWAERVSLVMETRELPAFSFPINFLHPIQGTPLQDLPLLEPQEALRIIAMVRLALPKRNIIICGGKEKVLKQMLPLIFTAGANGLLVGGYLTTSGRNQEDDINMIKEAGFSIHEGI